MTDVPGDNVGRGRGRPSGDRLLTLDQIVVAALHLLDDLGPAGLSMRNLAGHLGVHSNAIYTYVADRTALESAIVERLLADADPTTLEGRPRQWRSRLTNFAASVRTVVRDHPGAMEMFMTAPMSGPVALAVGEGMLGCFVEAGLRPAQASRATYVTLVYVLGFLALDIAETDARPPLPNDGERTRHRRERFDGIDRDRYPLTAATAPAMAAWLTGGVFDWGLQSLFDGLVRNQ